jgi:hypothetical protein
MEEKMAEDSKNSNLINLDKDKAIDLISAALQGGALKLPFAASFPDRIIKTKEGEFFKPYLRKENVTLKEVVDGKVMDQFVIPARADGLYLLSLLAVLMEGISKDALADLGLTASGK